MANNVVKFYRGLAASYNSITHADGIYFATDTKKIIMNNAEYGGDSNKKVSDVALNANANGIVITYTDSTSTTLLLGKATVTADGLMSKEDKTKLDSLDPTASGSYESSLDPTVATVEKLGGIDAGTTVAQLTGKSYNEIFDTLIFPTVNPTFTAPSASISLKSYQNVQEIGANAPTAANFNVSFNAGAITLAGKKQNNRAGAQDMEASKILYGSSKVESTVTADGLMSKEDKTKLDSLDPTASGSYESSLDPTVATVEKLGGIDAGTTVAQLTGKSYNEIFDTLIFPTVNPTFTAPSASISLKSYQNVQEIGANAPTAANFNVSFNAGAITLAGKKQNNRAGAQDMEASKILYGSSKVESLPEKVVAGAMDYYYRAAYAKGPQPKDSKGNNYQTPLAAGSVDSGKTTVTGYRAAYSGLVSTNAITEEVIKGMTKTVSAKKTIKVSGPISEQYICFAAPAGWTVSNIKDSNNFDVTSSYATSTVSVTGLDGQAVNYTVYLSGKMTQPSTYYVNFN